MFTKINKRLAEIEDVLTRNNEDPSDYIGSEIDGKVEQKDFDDFKKNVIGEIKVESGFLSWSVYQWYADSEPKKKTLFEEIDGLKGSIKKIEEYLGIERIQIESKVDKYLKKTTKKNK